MSSKSRTDPKSGYSRVSSGKRVQLDDTTKEELLSCLNIDELDSQFTTPIESMFSNIENVLGAYEAAVKIFDNEPRPANIHAAILPVREKAFELALLITGLNDVVKEQLRESGFMIRDDIEPIFRLHNAALNIEKKYEGHDSRRCTPKIALEMVIIELHNIFNMHYKSTGSDVELSANKGFVKYLPRRKYSLNEFVKYCLRSGNIKFPKDLSPYLNKKDSKVQFCAL